MKTAAVVPAEVDFSDPAAPFSPLFGDVYHARSGAFEQAGHVFLGGNGLPGRWRGREGFTVLETGFGLGNNFLATWAAWRADEGRSARLRFVSVEKHPLRGADLRRALAASPEPALAQALVEAWPPLTPDLHLLCFDEGRVELLLAFGDVETWLRELVAGVDAFYLDGFAPAKNPRMWDERVFKSLARLAAPGATAATWSSARAVREGLQQAGFVWRRAEGFGGKRDITLADFAPRAAPRAPAARAHASAPSNASASAPAAGARASGARTPRVAIIGGGLAGAACAHALAREGLECVVLDRHAEPAAEASGNVAGLFHGVFHPDDGPHARLHRACALHARAAYAGAIAAGLPGRQDGLLRLVPELVDATPLQAQLDAAGLPPEYVQAWTPAQVAAAGGPACAAWFYPGGGWLSPAALVHHWLAREGIAWRGGAAVASLARTPESRWQLRDAAGELLVEADTVVLANAAAASALWRHARAEPLPADTQWVAPLATSRGQVSLVAANTAGVHAPARPIAGAGYALTLLDGRVMCGATVSDDDDPAPRLADHVHNLGQLAAVTAQPRPDEAAVRALVEAGAVQGRVGWRANSADRLPWFGVVPEKRVGDCPPDQPRHWPRVPGLHVCAGFGSRGLTWAPLAGRLLASWITGAPYPLPADLVDALDPARFATRRVRRGTRPQG